MGIMFLSFDPRFADLQEEFQYYWQCLAEDLFSWSAGEISYILDWASNDPLCVGILSIFLVLISLKISKKIIQLFKTRG